MGTAGDDTIGLFARCFIASVIAFAVLSPLYRSWASHSSWWDEVAARKVCKLLRVLISVMIMRNLWLTFQVIELGNPVQSVQRDIHYYWTFGNELKCVFKSVFTLPLSPIRVHPTHPGHPNNRTWLRG